MRNQKVSSLLKLIGGALLAVSLFCLLSLSDVVRLHEALEGVPNGQLAGGRQRRRHRAGSRSAGVRPDRYRRDGDGTFAVEGALPELPADAQTMEVDGATYYVYTFEEFQALGGELDTDKFGAVESMEVDGVAYGLGNVVFGKNMWENMNAWSRFLVTVARRCGRGDCLCRRAAGRPGSFRGEQGRVDADIARGVYRRQVHAEKDSDLCQQQRHHPADSGLCHRRCLS